VKVIRYLRPLLPDADDYRAVRRTWRGDLLAGVTVGIVALPLALAFGISSGVGAEAGLVTAIVAGIVAAVFGGSNIQVSGPTGAMVVVLGPIVASHGPEPEASGGGRFQLNLPTTRAQLSRRSLPSVSCGH